MNCKKGDLAVVVDAYNPGNIGTILTVIRSHRNQKSLKVEPGDHIWLVSAPRPMTYECSGTLTYRKKGPVPDSYMRPIRGLPLGGKENNALSKPVKRGKVRQKEAVSR